MPSELYLASWGSIQLFCTELEIDGSRTKVVHDLTSGDVHPVQDRGLHVKRTKGKIVFDDFGPNFPAPVDAARAMFNAVGTGTSAMFTHPLVGSFQAGIGDFQLRLDESDNISADVEFIADDDTPPVTPAGAATSAASGEQAVSAAADDFDTETRKVLTDAEIRAILEADDGNGAHVSIADDARQSAASWKPGEDGSPTPLREVLIDVTRISSRIAFAIEAGGFESDLALWGAFRSAIMLGQAIRAAATSATSETPSTFVMRVTEPTALLPICARVYGGDDATDKARQVVQLNDIGTPGWLAPGDYTFPAKSTAQRGPLSKAKGFFF